MHSVGGSLSVGGNLDAVCVYMQILNELLSNASILDPVPPIFSALLRHQIVFADHK